MYEPGTLRPPTAADMARRELPLEVIKIEHHVLCHAPEDPAELAEWERFGPADFGCYWYRHIDTSYSHNVADLIAVCRDYGIPYEANVVTIGYEGERGLDWSHLHQCPDCLAWVATGQMAGHLEGAEHARRVEELERRTRALQERAAKWRADNEVLAATNH